MVLAHVDAVNIHRWSRAHIPLVQELAIFVEFLHAAVVAVVDEDEVTFRIDRNSVHAAEITRALFIRRSALFAPRDELLAILVILDDAGAVIAVAQIKTAIRLKGHEGWTGEMRIVGARHARRAQCQDALLAVMREFADEVVIGIHNPDVLVPVVRADLNVMRPSPDFVPLRPVFDDLAVAIQDDNDVIPAPINAWPSVVPISGVGAIGVLWHPRGVGNAATAWRSAGGLAQRQAHSHRELDARPKLRKPGGLELRKFRQQAFLRHKHPIGSFGENKGGLGVRPPLTDW